MSTTIVHSLLRTPHVLGHCDMCGLVVYCGTCHNNMCSGGLGDEGKCPDCPSAAELLQRNFSVPVVYSKVWATREDIQAWQTRMLKQIPEMAAAHDPEWVVVHARDIADRAFNDLVELERALAAARDVQTEQDKALLRWFIDHALLVQLITLAENESDLLVALTALQVWMKANPAPGDPIMSKKDVEREAKRLATLLQDEPRLGDRVIVTVLRNNPEELSFDVGVESVRGARSAADTPQVQQVDTSAFPGRIRVVTKRKTHMKRRPGKA